MGEGKRALPELKGKTKEYLMNVLERARDTGLVSHISQTYFEIHPALPWFLRQLFARHYHGEQGCSTATAALSAWVEAIGALGESHRQQLTSGYSDFVGNLALEEADLLQARRIARRHNWWDSVISAMQGIDMLFYSQGRLAEWSRLVAEVTPDFCTAEDAPISDREEHYDVFMAYRIILAKDHYRDFPKAIALQEKVVGFRRQRATSSWALPPNALLDGRQKNEFHRLAVATGTLGQILREQNNPACVKLFDETACHCQRIGDNVGEGIACFDLGQAHITLPSLRSLDAAEAAFKRGITLCAPSNKMERSKCFAAIAMVHYERFKDSRRGNEAPEIVLKHAQEAENNYIEALRLRPSTANCGPIYNHLGILYKNVGQTDKARDHYERAAQYFEQYGDRHNAGHVRYNIALMFMQAAQQEANLSRKNDLLHRAQAYAQAALRDCQPYQGHAAAEEADVHQLLDRVAQALRTVSFEKGEL